MLNTISTRKCRLRPLERPLSKLSPRLHKSVVCGFAANTECPLGPKEPSRARKGPLGGPHRRAVQTPRNRTWKALNMFIIAAFRPYGRVWNTHALGVTRCRRPSAAKTSPALSLLFVSIPESGPLADVEATEGFVSLGIIAKNCFCRSASGASETTRQLGEPEKYSHRLGGQTGRCQRFDHGARL